MAVDDRHGLLYVSHYGDNTVAIINAHTDRVVNTMPVPPEPTAIAVSERADRLFVTSQETNTMMVIENKTAEKRRVVAILTVGLVSKESSATEGIAVNDKTATVYVCNQSDGKVFAFDRDTLKPLGDPIVLPFVYGLGLDVSTNRVYAGGQYRDQPCEPRGGDRRRASALTLPRARAASPGSSFGRAARMPSAATARRR